MLCPKAMPDMHTQVQQQPGRIAPWISRKRKLHDMWTVYLSEGGLAESEYLFLVPLITST